MVQTCSAYGCKNRYDKDRDISFHKYVNFNCVIVIMAAPGLQQQLSSPLRDVTQDMKVAADILIILVSSLKSGELCAIMNVNSCPNLSQFC